MQRIVEMLDVDKPNQSTNDRDNFRKHITKIIQLLLERSRLRDLRRDALMDIANRRTPTR